MMHAYNKTYLEKAQVLLGRMLDFAVNELGYALPDFWKRFLESELSSLFEYGDPGILVGKSGYELAYDVLEYNRKPNNPQFRPERSREYWTGWALGYFQWYTSMSFEALNEVIPIKDIVKMYSPYHEMDITSFVEKVMEIYNERKIQTNLKKMREKLGLTQKELSERSGVPIRTIQQYEQRQKNINNAKAFSVLSLAKALFCDVLEILEPSLQN